MRFTLQKFLILSLAVHSLVFFWVFDRATVESGPGEKAPIEIDLTQSGSLSPGAVGGGAAGKAGELTLKDLSIDPFGDVLVDGGDEKDGLPSATSVLKSVQHSVLFEHLYQRIDNALFYPGEFRDNAIEGLARVELDLKRPEGGEDIEVFFRVRSSSSYVRVFVIQRLRQIFSSRLARAYVRPGQRVRIQCNIYLELTRTENAMDVSSDAMTGSNRVGIRGSVFSFYRSAKVAGQWKLGPFTGYGIVPSVGVDLEWIGERAARLAGNEPTVDALAKYRNDPAWGN